MNHAQAVTWLKEVERFFRDFPTHGEDRAHWANVYNAENARKIATMLQSAPSPACFAALADILERHGINSLDGVGIKTTLRGWARGGEPVKESLTTAKSESTETKIARQMLARTIEQFSTVDAFCEALADHPEKALSFLSGVALEVVNNPYRFRHLTTAA